MSDFSHLDKNGNAFMVDVTEKAVTAREAQAEGFIGMSPECYEKLLQGDMKKGDVLSVARVAGIMGAKRTSELIPLCHIINLTKVSIDFEPGTAPLSPKEGLKYIRTLCTVKCEGKTGVEMETLTGVSAALLTVYDMCKAVDRAMEITDIHLLRKKGGKSGEYIREC